MNVRSAALAVFGAGALIVVAWTFRPAPTELARHNRADLMLQAGLQATKEGRLPDALIALSSAVEASPSAQTHGAYGKLLLDVGLYEQAFEHVRLATRLEPDNTDFWLALANVYFLKVRLEEGRNALKTVRSLEPEIVLVREGPLWTRAGPK